MNTLESAIEEARRVGSPLHAALSSIVASRLCTFGAVVAVLPEIHEREYPASSLVHAVLAIRDGVYQWREPMPTTAAAKRTHCPDLDPNWPDDAGHPRGPTLCTSYPDCSCGRLDSLPAEIPDDGGPLVPDNVLRGLEAMQECSDRWWTDAAEVSDFNAAVAWIAAQRARKAGG